MHIALQTLLEPPRATPRPIRRRAPAEADTLPIITTRGRRLNIRPVTSEDTPLLADLLTRLSARSCELRFLRPLTSAEAIRREAERATQRSPQLGLALVATDIDCGVERAVALVELAHDPSALMVAELAAVVRDDYQGERIGTMMMRMLIEMATLRGVRAVRATLRADNRASRRMLQGAGLVYRATTLSSEMTIFADLTTPTV